MGQQTGILVLRVYDERGVFKRRDLTATKTGRGANGRREAGQGARRDILGRARGRNSGRRQRRPKADQDAILKEMPGDGYEETP